LNETVTEKGFKGLSHLQQLEEFIFFVQQTCHCSSCNSCRVGPRAKFYIDTKNYTLCIQYLPKLRVAGQRLIHDCRYPCNFYEISKVIAHGLLQVEKPCTLGLQEVAISSLPDGIELPNLTSLQLCRINLDFRCDSWLSKVSELGLFGISKDICVQVLTQVGRQLKILRVDVFDTLEVDVILRLSPNLQHLGLVGGPRLLTVATQVDPDTLRQMNVLELRFDRDYNNAVSADVLLQLLQAPEIRKLVLVCRFPEKLENAAEIIGMLQQHKILQKLECAILEGTAQSGAFSDLLLNHLTVNCPNLTDVSNRFACSMFDFCWNTDNALRKHQIFRMCVNR
jgi:hypothetical protein